MPIQPIDNLLIAPRSEATSRESVQNQAKMPAEQAFIRSETEEVATRDTERTNAMQNADGGKDQFDAKHKSKNEYVNIELEKKRKEEEKKLRQKAGIGGSVFDVTI